MPCGHGHSHNHQCDHHEPCDESQVCNLYLKIDMNRVLCLNETVEGSGKDVFKSWDNRQDREKFVESDADEELLFNIPFTGNVKLKGVSVIGGEDGFHPSKMKLYKNRENMTFDDVSVEVDQEFDMNIDLTGDVMYNTKAAKFSSIHCLSIYFPSNFGEDTTKIYYIGLKGDFTKAARNEIPVVNYELRPNIADHKHDLMNHAHQQIQ